MAKRRIFHIAKELNISHTEILSFLEAKGIVVASHMAPINEDVYKIVLDEFHKDKESVERYRKEQVRREIHDTRILEQQKANKKLNLLSLEKQRELEERERNKEKEELVELEKKKEQQKLAQQQIEELKANDQKSKSSDKKKLELEKKKEFKSNKKTFRKVELSEIESQVGTGTTNRPAKSKSLDSKKLKSTTATVKKIKASLETKSKKKVYKKDKSQDSDSDVVTDKKSINIAEFSSVDELSKIFEVPSNSIIQKCMGLGVLSSINQRLDWDIIELLTG